MSLSDLIKKRNRLTFLNTAHFAETITYTQDGVGKSIAALVGRRDSPLTDSGTGYARPHGGIKVAISTDATAGMASIKINEDTVTLREQKDAGDNKNYIVISVTASEDGLHTLNCMPTE